MYRDQTLWKKLRRRVLVDGVSIKSISRTTGISRKTIRKMLLGGAPSPHPPRGRGTKVKPTSKELSPRTSAESRRWCEKPDKYNAFEWMRSVLQNELEHARLSDQVGVELNELKKLTYRLYNGRLSERNKSMVILAAGHGVRRLAICEFLGIDRKTARKYLVIFQRSGTAGLFVTQSRSNQKSDDEGLRNTIFSMFHEPPSNYGINRTSWTMAVLARTLAENGHPACPAVIRKIMKSSGYRWRKARLVLTSSDPAYREKLDRVRSIISLLGPDEAFFSIDEFGPFAVKMKAGKTLSAPGELRIVPQWQKSRGSLIVTAALELSTNQIHHFFSAKKNTAEMIRMLELLIAHYKRYRTIYLSWDAASWHISKKLYEIIDKHNKAQGNPMVVTAPLPSGAQFLNVIESVFSGMARAIIHNSDYKSAEEAKAAITRYFAERNEHFKFHPQRAGKKIWRRERVPATFSEANNCKDPLYR
jgi:transposase